MSVLVEASAEDKAAVAARCWCGEPRAFDVILYFEPGEGLARGRVELQGRMLCAFHGEMFKGEVERFQRAARKLQNDRRNFGEATLEMSMLFDAWVASVRSADRGSRPTEQPPEFLLQFFAWDHLPPGLQEVSKPFGELAAQLVLKLPRNPERTVALRKLLEAKDCAVRARLAK